MAVKEMVLMNLVAKLDNLDYLMKKIVLSNQVHMVNAIEEIDESNFTLSMMEENVDEIVNMGTITPYKNTKNFKNIKEKMNMLMEITQVSPVVHKSAFEEVYNFEEIEAKIRSLYEGLKSLHNKRERYFEELRQLSRMKIFELLIKVDVDIGKLYGSPNFHMTIGTLTNENRKKLSQNYENVSAAVMHLGGFDGEEAILVVTPKALKKETERILRSVHFTPIDLIKTYVTTPKICMESLNKRIKQVEYELKKIEKESLEYREEYAHEISWCYSRLMMEETITKLKENIAMTRQFFYLSGWVAKEASEGFRTYLEADKNVIVEFKSVEEVAGEIKPPTLLKNRRLIKPFETLVFMYGTPSYNELDPTVFLALSYMLLFGAMFGDLGQGMVLGLAGWLLSRKMLQKSPGQLLMRLGASSAIFGFFYDSFFGYEHVISSIVGTDIFFIRPIENINTILGVSIVLGVVLLLISLAYSIINKLKSKDYQEGLFGRNGISGLVLYCSLLLIVASKAGLIAIGTGPLVALSLLCIGLIIIREPLTNYMAGRKNLYHESPSAYYVESGFDILETFLSMLSNSVSFIRVGAFALNHVGLFIAFHTMAEIIGNVAGQVSMFILGNVLVIFLEGLIVFIQGLRLVYYEMFSKYYTGAGKPFEAACIEGLEEM